MGYKKILSEIKMRKKFVFIFILILISIFLIRVFFFDYSEIKVLVINHSDKIIEKLKIIYTGGFYMVTKLLPEKSEENSINPESESNIEIEFEYFGGEKIRKTIDCYFEKNYSGSIIITIGNSGDVTWINKIEPGSLL